MDENISELDEKEIYDFLLKECNTLTQQIEELLKENLESPKKSKNQANPINEQFYDEKTDNQGQIKGDLIEKFPENEEEIENIDEKDYQKRKEALLNQKKYLEDKFLDINIDIQKKAKQLSDFEETIKKTKIEINNCDKQLKEKTEFIQFLETQIQGIKISKKK